MNILDRIKKLCKQHDMNVYQLEEALGFGRNTIYQWNKRIPGIDKLQLVADYFGVSTDYLLGRTENPNLPDNNVVTDADLDKVLDGVMSFDGKPLTEADREAVRAFMQGRKSK